MTITLPDDMREKLERDATAAGFASVDEYILSLVVEESSADAALPDVPVSRLTPKSREDLERMLDEGMNSGPLVRVTPEFWEERKRVLAERMAKRRGASS